MRRAAATRHHINQPRSTIGPHRAVIRQGIEISCQDQWNVLVRSPPCGDRLDGVACLGLAAPPIGLAATRLVVHDEQPHTLAGSITQQHLQGWAAKGNGLAVGPFRLPATIRSTRSQQDSRLHRGLLDGKPTEQRTLDAAVVARINRGDVRVAHVRQKGLPEPQQALQRFNLLQGHDIGIKPAKHHGDCPASARRRCHWKVVPAAAQQRVVMMIEEVEHIPRDDAKGTRRAGRNGGGPMPRRPGLIAAGLRTGGEQHHEAKKARSVHAGERMPPSGRPR
jgi:hypothetical protein